KWATDCNWGAGCIVDPWATGTYNNPGASLQIWSGRFMIQDSNGKMLWSTTQGSFNSELCLQNDGNLVVYDNGRAIWDSKTY
ncbi:hypothetical protein HDU99_006469, partial [Rhizoclosmatium hyalinum]